MTKSKGDTRLNPAMKRTLDQSHDLDRNPGPMETTNAHEGQGEGWPLIWLAAAILGAILALYLLF